MREPIAAGMEGCGAVVRRIAWTCSVDGGPGRAPQGDGGVDNAVDDGLTVDDRRAVDVG